MKRGVKKVPQRKMQRQRSTEKVTPHNTAKHHLKSMFIEESLQFFVREIDAQLLKAVVLENFEPKYIQDANERATALASANQTLVYATHEPIK
jgi:hypothetical protein